MQQPYSSVPNYAIAEREASFSAAARVVRQTGSYPRERASAVMGLTGLVAGALVAGIALTAVISFVSRAAAGVVFLAVCLGIALGLMPVIERRFFAMRCAFTFLATEALLRRSAIPQSGTGEAAKQFLAQRFGDLAGPVYDAHMEVRRRVGQFFRTFDRVSDLLPIDVGPLRSALGWMVDRIAPRIADLALSHAITRNDADYATSADDAVTYVAQNAKALLSTATRAWITERALGWIVGSLTLAVSGGATFAIVGALTTRAAANANVPTEGAQTIGIFAAVFAAVLVGGAFAAVASWFVRLAFIEPVCLTMLLVRYHVTIQGQAVDPSVRAKLHEAPRAMSSANKLASLFE